MSAAPRPARYRMFDGDLEALAAPVGNRLIVTPNLDHLRLLTGSKALRHAYRAADLVLNDSRFLDHLAYRGRVFCLTGADLAPEMMTRLPAGGRVMVIGCTPAVEEAMVARYPTLSFQFHNPSMGFIHKRAERRAIAAMAVEAAPDCLFICTGCPQSELLAAQIKRAGSVADILCCGSGLLFLAGASKRAPVWSQRLGGEWLWRFLHEPRTRERYALDFLFLVRSLPVFAGLRRNGVAQFERFGLVCE